MVIEWLKTMSSETFDDVNKRRMFNPCSGPDLVYINGRPLLVFKSDGFSSVVRISAEEIQYTGQYSRCTDDDGNPVPMPFLIFYDLDDSQVVDQIYGGEEYLAHGRDGEDDYVYCLVTNYYGLHDTDWTKLDHG